MKKTLFVVILALVSTGAFAEFVDWEWFDWNTPDGKYSMVFSSVDKNSGQQTAGERMELDNRSSSVSTRITLSDTEWGLIKRVLDKYKHSRGDAYVIGLSNNAERFVKTVVVEFTSTAQYNYWVWSHVGALPLPPGPPGGEDLFESPV